MTQAKSKLSTMISEARRSPKYWTAMSSLQFGDGLRRLMKTKGLSQRDLAAMLQRSEAWVSKILNGTENLTLRKMNEIAMLLRAAVHVHVAPQDCFVDWSEVARTDLHVSLHHSEALADAGTAPSYVAEASLATPQRYLHVSASSDAVN